MLNVDDVKMKLIKYFLEKNIQLIDNENCDNTIVIEYKKHYSNYYINLYLRVKNNNVVIQYYSPIKYLKKYRTSTITPNFCKRVYDVFLVVKHDMDEDAEETKNKIDLKNKYAIELERHYIKKHDRIYIDISSSSADDVKIYITGYDDDKRTEYNILIRNNKYYLYSFCEYGLTELIN
jgi:hypothetical protein